MASTIVNTNPSNDVEVFYYPEVVEEATSYILLTDRDSLAIPSDSDGSM